MIKSLLFLMKQVWKYQKSYIFYSIFFQFSKLMKPIGSIVFPKYIIDELMGAQDTEKILLYIISLLLCSFFGDFFSDYFEGKIFVARGIVFNKFQCQISEKLMDCDYENIENPDFLDVKERARKFLYANGQGFGVVLNSAFNILGNLILFAGIVMVVSMLSVWVVIIFVILVLLSTAVDLQVRKNYTKWDMEKAPVERKTAYLLNIAEDFSFGKDIRIYGAKKFLLEKISRHLGISSQFYEKQIKVLNKSRYFNTFMTLLRDATAYAYLVYKVLAHAISIGDFSMYINAVTRFSGAMNELLSSILDIRQFSGYYDALDKYLNVPSTMREGEKRTDMDRNRLCIQFCDVSFRYPGQNSYALNHIDLTIRPGEKIALTGENGAGKSTTVKLMNNIYKPTRGRITVDGIDTKEQTTAQIASHVGYVFQNPNDQIFNDDVVREIEYVLRYWKLPKEEIRRRREEAIDVTGIRPYLETHPFDIPLPIRKFLTIAVVVAVSPDYVILDEPTAALDPIAENDIYRKYNEMTQGVTSFFISHRLASTSFCDRIILLEDGRIAEQGTHEELLAKQGRYWEMFNVQSRYYTEGGRDDF